MRNKAWPFWDQWRIIFGKDCAVGSGAEDIADGAQAFRKRNFVDIQDYTNDYHVNMDGIPEEVDTQPQQTGTPETLDESTGQSESNRVNKRWDGTKRKSNISDEALMEFLTNLHDESNSRLEMISARIGYEFDLGQARQAVYDKLGTVEGLTLPQRYDLCDIKCKKPQRLEIFMGMPVEARLGYVLRFLNPN